jgi:hypothetical protein
LIGGITGSFGRSVRDERSAAAQVPAAAGNRSKARVESCRQPVSPRRRAPEQSSPHNLPLARPHAAAGTAKAAADGWALAEALDTHQSVTDALEAWQQSQLRRAKELLDRTRRVGAKSQFLNTWDPADPELVFGLDQPGAPAIPAASESVVPQSINKFS